MAEQTEKQGFSLGIFKFLSKDYRGQHQKIKEQLEQRESELLASNRLLEELGVDSQTTNPSAIASDQRQLTDIMNEMSRRVDLRCFQSLYLRNQFIFRAVNIRASEMVSRGYDIIGEDSEGVKKCSDLIKNSGGESFLRQSSINADVFGNNYWEHILSQGGKDILLLRQVHPLTFGFKYDEVTHTIIFGDDKTPLMYAQKVFDPELGTEILVDVPKDKITHIKYNTFGDEFSGISTLQPGYDTLIRLMNMEKAAALAAIKTANPLMVLKTNAKSPLILGKWMKTIGKLNGQQEISLGEDQTIEFLSPGRQNFNDYADYFLDAVVSDTGVPKSILLGSGGDNRAETITLSKHFYRAMRDNQLIFETGINELFQQYADLSGFKAPKFVFRDVAEDADATGQRAVELFQAGLIDREEARTMIGLSLGGSSKVSIDGTSKEIKNQDMESWHPYEPGSPAGSQSGNKTKMKSSQDSSFKGEGLPNIK
jgi:hypothetical protein